MLGAILTLRLSFVKQLSLETRQSNASFRRGLPEGKEKHFDSAVDVPLPDCTPVW